MMASFPKHIAHQNIFKVYAPQCDWKLRLDSKQKLLGSTTVFSVVDMQKESIHFQLSHSNDIHNYQFLKQIKLWSGAFQTQTMLVQ